MSNAEITSRLVAALEAAAAAEAGDNAALVSVNVEILSQGNGNIETLVERKTRTLIFMSAELAGEAGLKIARASSVHKITS